MSLRRIFSDREKEMVRNWRYAGWTLEQVSWDLPAARNTLMPLFIELGVTGRLCKKTGKFVPSGHLGQRRPRRDTLAWAVANGKTLDQLASELPQR